MKKLIIKIFIILFFIIIISFIFIILLSKNISKTYLNYSEIEMKRVVTTVINKTINDIDFDDNIFILKEIDNIKVVDYNPITLNKIISTISNNVYDNLRLIEKMDINTLNKFNIDKNIFYIPSFIIFDSVMLNNIGPRIPIKLEIIEAVNSNILTKVTEYGINNSLIEISIKVNVSCKMVLPLSSSNLEVEVIVPFAIKIIQGNIPEYYFGDLIKRNN